MLFHDILIPCIEYSSILTSKKAAAAVYAAIQILNMDKLYELGKTESFVSWTPTLEYYSGYTEMDLYLLGYQMTDKVLKALQSARKVINSLHPLCFCILWNRFSQSLNRVF